MRGASFSHRCKYIVLFISGPFALCHDFVDPATYYDACLYDLCATLPEEDQLCDSLMAYVQICREAGVNLGTWRDDVAECRK